MDRGFFTNMKDTWSVLGQGKYPYISNIGNVFKVIIGSKNAPPWPPTPNQPWPPPNYNPLNANLPIGQYKTDQPATLGGLQPVPGYSYTPYQIKASDTFASIASSTGFDVPAIQAANNGMIIPPPKGTYINLPGTVSTETARTGSAEFMNTQFMKDYAARGTDFLNQKRWDTKTKKFVKIGDLIRQGRLDLRTGHLYNQGRKRKKNQGDQ
jgi:LysM repeat protein